ncbi:short-chain dehydrogenase/reductase SDR family protein [Rhodotorula toruloides]|uniref:Short-chain dehydrogenase/reductase SDR family protein n=1 Tax=Rhodotorula toruloides TaxID=5286 RepID=A0A511KPR8_RHOTO|nr:short-chain dehydrogenase/reductase SDR family protein [Rhodotorula toruloides]
MSNIVASFQRSKFDQTKVPDLSGKVFVLTGGTNGIGLSVARTLFKHGGRVILLSSKQETGKAACEYIKTGDLGKAPHDYKEGFGTQGDNSANGATEDGQVEWRHMDGTDLKEVADVAKKLAGELDRLDGFLAIAGLGVNAFKLTKDGYDSHLTINCLTHILLLSQLLPVLEKTSRDHPDADVRFISMASEMHRFTFGGPGEKWGGSKFADEEEFKKDVGPTNLYSRTKLGNILTVKALVDKYLRPPSKVLAYAVHPGGVATGQNDQIQPAYGQTLGKVVETLVRPILRAPDDGALSTLWAATGPEAREGGFENGSYYTGPAEEGKETSEATDPELIDNFWNTSLSILDKVVGRENVGPFKA